MTLLASKSVTWEGLLVSGAGGGRNELLLSAPLARSTGVAMAEGESELGLLRMLSSWFGKSFLWIRDSRPPSTCLISVRLVSSFSPASVRGQPSWWVISFCNMNCSFTLRSLANSDELFRLSSMLASSILRSQEGDKAKVSGTKESNWR